MEGVIYMNNKKNTIISIALVITIIFLVSGITYAFYTFSSEDINYTGDSNCFNVFYINGDDIGSNENTITLMPSYTYNGGLSSTFKINFSDKCSRVSASGKLYLDTLDNTSSNLYKEGLLNYQLLINNEVTSIKGSITSSGTTEIDLGVLNKGSAAIDEYTVYVWLDYNKIENKHASSKYYGKLRVEVSQIGV